MELEMSGTLKDFDGEDLQADAQVKDWAQLVGEMLPKVSAEDRTKFIERVEKLGQPLTVRKAIITVLGAALDNLTPEEKMNAFKIGARLPKEGKAEFSAEEQVLIKKLSGLVFRSPMYAGQLNMIIDGKEPYAA